MRTHVLPIAVTVLLAAACFTAPAKGVPIYKSGHADIGVHYEDGEFHPHWHFGSNAKAEGLDIIANQEFEPESVVARVPDAVKVSLPLSGFEFTGGAGGSDIWVLPQSSTPGIPFLGLATDELESSDWVGPIQFALTNVLRSPLDGYFSLWQTTFFGSKVRFTTYGGIGVDDEFSMPVGGHDHFNWGFTKPGVYELELTFSGTHITDGLLSASGRFTFLVGDTTVVPEPGAWLLVLSGLAPFGLGWLRRRV